MTADCTLTALYAEHNRWPVKTYVDGRKPLTGFTGVTDSWSPRATSRSAPPAHLDTIAPLRYRLPSQALCE